MNWVRRFFTLTSRREKSLGISPMMKCSETDTCMRVRGMGIVSKRRDAASLVFSASDAKDACLYRLDQPPHLSEWKRLPLRNFSEN